MNDPKFDPTFFDTTIFDTPPPPTGSGGLLDSYWRKKPQNELFTLIKEYLEVM